MLWSVLIIKGNMFPFFFRSTFVGSVWSFVFFIPSTTANDLRLQRIFYPRFYPLHLFSYLNSWERASIFPFECSMLNKGTTGTILKNIWYDAVLDWGLNPGPPALEASTLALGYRGGGQCQYNKHYIGLTRKINMILNIKFS